VHRRLLVSIPGISPSVYLKNIRRDVLTFCGDFFIVFLPVTYRRFAMRKKPVLMLGLVCLLGLVLAHNSLAAIYKYVDNDGMINFADDLQAVPAQYRASAKIVSGEADEKRPAGPLNREQPQVQPGTGAREPATAVAPAGMEEKRQPVKAPEATGSFGKRAFTSTVVAVSAVFIFIILGILDTDHKKAIAVVRVAVLWGVALYLIYAHAGDVGRIFSAVGGKIESVQQQSEEKGKNAARAVKSLNALVEQVTSTENGGADAEKKE
jgi:hypothetical protein